MGIAMRYSRAWAWLWLAACSSPSQELSPEVLRLARIKVHMEENLIRLPNYTCLETIERSRRPAPSNRFRLVDTVRLEVALVDRKELFAWPGARQFEDREIGEMVQSGAIGNGNFGLYAYGVFLSLAPAFTCAGDHFLNGRRTVRYDYRVPLNLSRYKIKVPSDEATVGYHGSFWADTETLDLVRLSVHADDIPPRLEISAAESATDYSRVRIGEEEFLLPVASQLLMTDTHGNESRNRIQFSGCRKYTGTAFLSFAEAPEADSKAQAGAVTEVRLPAGLSLDLKFLDDIDSDKSFVGDPVRALVTGNVKKDGLVLVPKGATAFGRIVRMERVFRPFAHIFVGVQFHSLEFEGKRAPFVARLEYAGTFLTSKGVADNFRPVPDQRPGLMLARIMTGRLFIPRGFPMRWKTDATLEQAKP